MGIGEQMFICSFAEPDEIVAGSRGELIALRH